MVKQIREAGFPRELKAEEETIMGAWNTLKSYMPWTEAFAEKKLANEIVSLGKEMGIYKDTRYEMKDQEDINPDQFGIDVWDKMLTDGQVKSGLDMIKLSVTSRGFTLTGTSDETREYAEFITQMLESLDGNLEDNIIEMLTALEYGYSVTEKVIEQREGKYVLKKLKTLNPNTITLKTNKFGDLMYARQRIGLEDIKLPARNVILYSHDKRFGNPYGRSILRTTYKHWFIKDKIYKFANIAYERYGTPLLYGKVQDSNDVGKMDSILRRINGMSSLSISAQDSIEAIQLQSADFIGYIEHHDRKIMESLLVNPQLLGNSRGQSGSYAQSEVQMSIFLKRLESIQREVKSLIEEQIIRPLIDINFPNVKEYPSFNFKPLMDDDIQKLATVFVQMIQAGIIAPSEEWIRERLGMPPLTDEARREIEENRQTNQAIDMNPNQVKQGQPTEQDDPKEKKKAEENPEEGK